MPKTAKNIGSGGIGGKAKDRDDEIENGPRTGHRAVQNLASSPEREPR
jgi:hypothetical protein